MGTGSLKAAVIGGIAAAAMACVTAAIAGTGVGGIFNLGVDNSVDGQTLLHGNTGGNRRDGAWPPLLSSPRVAVYEIAAHALFGAVLGTLLKRGTRNAHFEHSRQP